MRHISYLPMSRPVRLWMAAYDGLGYALRRARLPRPLPRPERICVLTLNNIGDAVLTLPTVEALAAMFPEAKLTMVSKPAAAPLLATCPDVAEAVGLQPLWKASARAAAGLPKTQRALDESLGQLAAILRERQPQLVVACEPDWMLARELRRLDIPCVAGFVEAGGGFHLNIPAWSPNEGPQARRIFALAEAVAAAFGLPAPEFRPAELKPDTAKVAQMLKDEPIDPKKLVVLHPVSTVRTKDWLPERWATVIEALTADGYQLVTIGDKGTALPGTLDLCGRLNLNDTAALLSLARLFIGVDSGPGHIAAAAGCPVISIFSSVNDPTRWAPTGQRVTVLYKEVADRSRFPLHASALPEGIEGNPYIEGISAEMALAAARDALQ